MKFSLTDFDALFPDGHGIVAKPSSLFGSFLSRPRTRNQGI